MLKRQMSTCNHGPIKKNCGELSKRLKITIAVQSWLMKNTFFSRLLVISILLLEKVFNSITSMVS